VKGKGRAVGGESKREVAPSVARGKYHRPDKRERRNRENGRKGEEEPA